MASIKIPTPLRAYAGGQAQVNVTGATVGAALNDLTDQYPELRPHLFNGAELRNFVNVFLGEEDVRFLDGLDTEVDESASLRIIPSIAGGAEVLRKVDQTGLKVGQAATIILLLVGFVLNGWLLVAFVAVAQLLGAFDAPYAPYRLFYQQVIKPSNTVKPNVIIDNPEPHRFAMLLGGIMNGVAAILLLAAPGASTAAWVLVWIVIALANLNFWLNFCVGCLIYYQLNRLGVPGFTHAPIQQG